MMSDLTVPELKKRVHEALKQWHKSQSTSSPLAPLTLYQSTLKTKKNIQLATNHVLLQGLERMEEYHPRDVVLLRRCYLDNEKNYRVASDQNKSVAQLQKDLKGAWSRLAEVLLDLEMAVLDARQETLSQRLERPSYTNLIAVDEHIAKLATVLCGHEEHWLVSIEGIGGIGKTSLADALVRHLLDQGAVEELGWVTARAQAFDFGYGLSSIDRPALTPDALVGLLVSQLITDVPVPPERAREMLRERLKESPHLIVIDNLETLADVRGLLKTLRSLANPSKFLLTSRERLYAESDVYTFPVPELDVPNAIAFIRQEAAQRNVSHLSGASDEALHPIIDTVGGNPLAIRLVVGQAHVHDLDTVLDNLKQARGKRIEELYTFIYRQAWEELDITTRLAFTAMPLTTTYGATLAQLAKISEIEPRDLVESLELLVSLNLVDGCQTLNERRYSIHNLTRAFLHEQVFAWV